MPTSRKHYSQRRTQEAMGQLLYYETHEQPQHTEWMLLVHGAGGSTRTWKRQVEPLGQHYNLLIVDLPGHGESRDRTSDVKSYSFEFVAEKVWEVADELNIKKVHLVGISLGTILCMQMRLLAPERVSTMVMAGAIVRLNARLRILARVSLALAKIIGYGTFYKLSAYIMMPRNNHKQSRDVFIKESKALTTAEFKKWTQLYFQLNATLNAFFDSKSKVPHLLVMGSQDHLFLPPAKSYAATHLNAKLSVIPKCGHVVSIEKADRFNTICMAFLDRIKAARQKQVDTSTTTEVE